MKKIALFLMIFQIQMIISQDLKPGIYEIQEKIDTAFMRSISKTHIENWSCVKKEINQQFCHLIEEKYDLKYVVLANLKNESGKMINKLIFLNKKKPQTNTSYGDEKVRNYYQLYFSVEPKFDKTWIDQTRDSDFNYFGFGNFFDDYALQQENKRGKKNVGVAYDYNNFYKNGDTFYLKNSGYRVYQDTITFTIINNGYPADVRYDLCKFTTLHQVDGFKLKEEKKYIDILSIQDNMIFNSDSNKINLNPGDFIAITKETKEWYFGDLVNTDGSYKSGKIYKEDLLQPFKVKFKKLHDLKLKIMYTHAVDSTSQYGEYDQILRIKIYNKNGKLHQILENPGLLTNPNDLIGFIDVNFDGYKDLSIYGHDGGAGPNSGNNYYIFNPKTKKFIFNQALSDCTQTEIDAKNKCILSHYRSGAATHGTNKYKWINGELTEVEFYETHFLDDDKVEVTHQFLKNGKMQGKTKIVDAKNLKRLD